MSEVLRIAPSTPTPAMIEAADDARADGKDFSGQYAAAMAAFTPGTTGKKRTCTVTPKRGEELRREFEEGASSLAAKELFKVVLAGNKRRALRILRDECMEGQNAQDFYAYLRHTWTGHSLTIVEVPLKEIERVVHQFGNTAQFLVKQGLQVSPAGVLRRRAADEKTTFLLPSGHELGLDEVKQLWAVVTVE